MFEIPESTQIGRLRASFFFSRELDLGDRNLKLEWDQYLVG